MRNNVVRSRAVLEFDESVESSTGTLHTCSTDCHCTYVEINYSRPMRITSEEEESQSRASEWSDFGACVRVRAVGAREEKKRSKE